MRKSLKLFGALVLALVLALPGNVAYAWDAMAHGVLYQGLLDRQFGNNQYGAVVSAYNQYDAACYVFGTNPDTLTSDIKLKLSDPNYGGHFYEYAETFFTQSGVLSDVPDWVPAWIVLAGEFNDLFLADYQAIWYSTATKTLHDYAKEDFKAILAGEDLGGGGESGGGSDVSGSFPSSVTLGTAVGVYVNGRTWSTSFSEVHGSQVMNFSNTAALSSYFDTINCSYLYVMNAPWEGRNNGRSVSPNVLYYASASPIEFSFVNASGDYPYLTITAVSDSSIWFGQGEHYFGNSTFYTSAPNLSGTVTNDLSTLSLSNKGNSYSYVGKKGSGQYRRAVTYVLWNGAPSVSPPDGDWPTPTPTPTPTAPEIPTPTAPTIPSDPTVTEPTVTWPDINITVEPAPVVVTETPSGLDYTDLLTRINDNLISLDAYTKAINSDLNSLRADLLTGFDGLVQGLRNIYQYLQHLDDLLERHCKHIRDSIDENVYELELYLKGLFEWLPEQLNFDASFNYDDSGVIGWLKKIYGKLGGGSSAPNPIIDPSGFFAWLLGIIAGFLGSLLAGLPDKVQELLTDLSDLTGYFPFSAPWDLYALLALFAHDPVTPVITIPWGIGSDTATNVVVDCTPWDGVMSIVREVEKVIFAGGLARFTFELFKPTDVLGD